MLRTAARCLALLGWLMPLWCAAAEPTARDEATRLTTEAYEMQRRGALNEAIQRYQEAAALEPLPKRFRNLAVPLEQAGRLIEALAAYRRFLRDAAGEPAEYQRDVSGRVAALLPRLATLQIAVTPANEHEVPLAVRVRESEGDRPRCLLEGAERSGARFIDVQPWRYLCQPGPVAVTLALAGQELAARAVILRAGETQEVAFAARAPVRIEANRARPQLLLDQVPLVLAPPARLPVTVPLLLGRHVLLGRDGSDGKDQAEQRFTVTDPLPAAPPLVVRLGFRPSRRWVWAVVAGGAAVLAAGAVGLALGLPPQPKGADVSVPPPRMP